MGPRRVESESRVLLYQSPPHLSQAVHVRYCCWGEGRSFILGFRWEALNFSGWRQGELQKTGVKKKLYESDSWVMTSGRSQREGKE